MKTVSIAGLPNAGKSTLVNAFCNRKISIISPKPHTTQVNITASIKYKNHDIVFFDTPGMTKSGRKFWAVDAGHYLFVIDAHKRNHDSDFSALESLSKILEESFSSESKLTVVLNKIDTVKKEYLLPLVEKFKSYTQSIFMVSARNYSGVESLLDHILKNSKDFEGLHYEDTEKNDEFMITEMIREKIFQHTHKEIPYYTTLKIEKFDKDKSEIHCSIIVKKDSHKKIVIGSGGEMIKKIRVKSQYDLQNLWKKNISLFLFVKVVK